MTKAELERLGELSKRYVRSFDRRRMRDLPKEILLAIAFEAGLKSRAGTEPKHRTPPTKVFVKPKAQ